MTTAIKTYPEIIPMKGKQLDVMTHIKSEDTSYLAYGAFRSGKTYSALFGFFLQTQALDMPYQHLLLGRNLKVLEKECVRNLLDFAAAFGIPAKYRRMDQTLKIGDQEYMVVAGHDQDSEGRIRGLLVHSIFIDETTLVPEEFFETAFGRLFYEDSKLWLTCNPANQGHWLKRKWVDEGKIDRVMLFLMEDNPALGAKVIERNKEIFSGVFRRRMVEGLWANAEGAIYPYYLRQKVEYSHKHVKHIDVGVDYGIRNPTAFVMDVVLESGKNYIERSFKYDGTTSPSVKTDQDLVEDLKTFIGEEIVRNVYVDPSARSFINALRRMPNRGFAVKAAQNDLLPGIRTCLNMFMTEKLIIAPDKSNNSLEDSISGYVWDEEAIDDKPVQENDHEADALRYVVYANNRNLLGDKVIDLPEGY